MRKVYVVNMRASEDIKDFESGTDHWQPLACFETKAGAEAQITEHKHALGFIRGADFPLEAEFEIQEIPFYKVYPDGA